VFVVSICLLVSTMHPAFMSLLASHIFKGLPGATAAAMLKIPNSNFEMSSVQGKYKYAAFDTQYYDR